MADLRRLRAFFCAFEFVVIVVYISSTVFLTGIVIGIVVIIYARDFQILHRMLFANGGSSP